MSLFKTFSGRMECFVHILIRQQSRCLVLLHLNTTPSRLSPILTPVKTFTRNLITSQTSTRNLITSQNNKLLMLGIKMVVKSNLRSMNTQSRPNQECIVRSQPCLISIGMSLKPKQRNQNSTIVCGQGQRSSTQPTVTSRSRTLMMSLLT